jgi:hypothetical protein
MKTSGIVKVVGKLAAIDVSDADVECCTQVLHDLTQVIAWAEAGTIEVAQRLTALAVTSPVIFPEHTMATATRVSLGQGMQPFKRAGAIEAMPIFGEALTEGTVSAAHVDVIATAIGKLQLVERERFAERDQFLADVAKRTTPGEFARTVRTEMIRCQRGDGLDVLARQKQATYLKTWFDHATGMWCLHGELDPETGARLHTRLTRTIENCSTTPHHPPPPPTPSTNNTTSAPSHSSP